MKFEHTSVLLACSAASASARKLAILSLAALALTGCGRLGERPEQVAGWALVDSAHRHPILVSQEPQTMNVRIGKNAQGLNPKQRADILEFADRSRASDAGNSRLVISAPSGAANEVASMYAVNQIRRILSDNGFAESSIAVEAYHDDTDRDPPIRVSYLRYVAQGPECGSWPTNLAKERNNLPYPNFGCATQHNFAAMVANPGDLLGPRTETNRPGERRDVVWDKYIQGESTVAKKTEDEKVKVKSN